MARLNPVRLEKALLKRAKEDLRRHNISCAAMQVWQSGHPVCTLYCGYQDFSRREHLQPGAIFRLASMTKPVTAAACLLAVQQGLFQLEDDVAEYLPQYASLDLGRIDGQGRPALLARARQNLKIWHLLTHSSGLLSADELGSLQQDLMPHEAYADLDTAVAYYAGRTFLSFEPGSRTSYSGYASFDVLALIISKCSGLSYSDFISKYLFQPLGVKDLTFTPDQDQWQRMVSMADKAVNGLVTVEMGRHTFEKFPLTYTCAGASLAGSLEDYARFAQLLLDGSWQGKSLIDKQLIEQMRTPRMPLAEDGAAVDSWGLGGRVTLPGNRQPVGAYGWSCAYGTHFWVDTQHEISAVYLKNMRWHDSHGHGLTGSNFESDVMSALV